jgi:biopolymer transport protein ExbB/TolQ
MMIMSSVIITSLISGLCVAIPNIFATLSMNKRNQELINYKIDELSKRVDKHNNIIERTYKIEERLAVIEDDIRDLKKGR